MIQQRSGEFDFSAGGGVGGAGGRAEGAQATEERAAIPERDLSLCERILEGARAGDLIDL